LPPQQATRLVEQVALPTLAALARRGSPFRGVLYCGLMLTPAGPRVLEFNARFGDPEAQPLLLLLEDDLLELLWACAVGRLGNRELRWRPGAAACVVLAAAGYPGAPRSGDPVSLPKAQADVLFFQAGTAWQGDTLVTAGGRVLGVTAYGADLPSALSRAYAGVEQVHFAGMQWRTDIGRGR